MQLFPNAGGRASSSRDTGGVVSISFHNSGNYLVSCSTGTENNINIWDLREGRLLHAIQGVHVTKKRDHRSTGCVAFSSDGTHFASGGVDNLVKVWNTQLRNITGGEPPLVSRAPFPSVTRGRWTADFLPRQSINTYKNQRPVSAPSSTQLCRTTSVPTDCNDTTRLHVSADELTDNTLVEVSDFGVDNSTTGVEAALAASYPSTDVSREPTEPRDSSNSALKHIVEQLDLLTKTLALLEMRVSVQEGNIEQLMAASLNTCPQQSVQSLPEPSPSSQSTCDPSCEFQI